MVAVGNEVLHSADRPGMSVELRDLVWAKAAEGPAAGQGARATGERRAAGDPARVRAIRAARVDRGREDH
ncbi:hypothetical protein Aglo03_46110 [Actinokineospora globicatena]|uniref:Uncharacterized protein n=1 Tax=Actinokineospora globicatena TaxID=103729 RepID=A0A9W6QPU7_9PSEU|nr:hypothetical protein Aglo03_46110 [Actinokineospora globicatena]